MITPTIPIVGAPSAVTNTIRSVTPCPHNRHLADDEHVLPRHPGPNNRRERPATAFGRPVSSVYPATRREALGMRSRGRDAAVVANHPTCPPDVSVPPMRCAAVAQPVPVPPGRRDPPVTRPRRRWRPWPTSAAVPTPPTL